METWEEIAALNAAIAQKLAEALAHAHERIDQLVEAVRELTDTPNG